MEPKTKRILWTFGVVVFGLLLFTAFRLQWEKTCTEEGLVPYDVKCVSDVLFYLPIGYAGPFNFTFSINETEKCYDSGFEVQPNVSIIYNINYSDVMYEYVWNGSYVDYNYTCVNYSRRLVWE